MRKDGPPKLGKNDPDDLNKFDFKKLKGKAIEIKVKHEHNSQNVGPRPSKLEKTDSKRFDLSNLKSKISSINEKKLILAAIGLMIIVVLIALIATGGHHTVSNNTNNTTIAPVANLTNHYDNGNISFDYPKGWNISTQKVQAPLIVTVEKDENNSFSVFSENLGKTSFSDRVVQWRQSILQNGAITYEGNTTVDGIKGYNIEATYKTNGTIYNTRGVAISKNNTAYFIIFIYNTSLLNYKDDMDQVINTFHVK